MAEKGDGDQRQHKRVRADDAPIAMATSTLVGAAERFNDICVRVAADIADTADLKEMLRLTAGALFGEMPHCSNYRVMAGFYRTLWEALDADAIAAIAHTPDLSGWPPTLDDVQRTYARLDSSGVDGARVRRVGVKWTIADLADAVGVAARRADAVKEIGASPLFPGYSRVFSDDWERTLDPTDPACLRGCDPTARYFVVESGEADYADSNLDPQVVLFRSVPGRSPAVVASVEVYHDVLLEEFCASNFKCATVPQALVPYSDDLLLFLSLLATVRPAGPDCDADGARDCALLYEPTPAGAAQVKRALLTLPSRWSLPSDIALHIKREFADGWLHEGVLRCTWLTEHQLVLALMLCKAQLTARRVLLYERQEKRDSDDPQSPPSLAAMAIEAYRGEIRRGMAPGEVLERMAASAGRRICSGPALPTGRFIDAGSLLDVAAFCGHRVDAAEAHRPELLAAADAYWDRIDPQPVRPSADE